MLPSFCSEAPASGSGRREATPTLKRIETADRPDDFLSCVDFFFFLLPFTPPPPVGAQATVFFFLNCGRRASRRAGGRVDQLQLGYCVARLGEGRVRGVRE